MKSFLPPIVYAAAVAALFSVASCAGTMTATVSPPQLSLVALGDGVWVVEDHAEPVFYTDSVYWRFLSGHWYRAPGVTGPWHSVDVAVVPTAVARIDRPRQYVRYRAHTNKRRRYVEVRKRGRGHHESRSHRGHRKHKDDVTVRRDHR